MEGSTYILKHRLNKIKKQLILTGNEFESLVIEIDKNVFSSKQYNCAWFLQSSNFFIEVI